MQPFMYVSDLLLSRPERPRAPLKRQIITWLIVILLLGAGVFALTSRDHISVDQSTGTFSIEKDGLQLSATIPPGPYFLQEMLSVHLSVVNHTPHPVRLGPPFGRSVCGYDSGVDITGGKESAYKVPVTLGVDDCPGGYSTVTVQSGKSLATETYILLLNSGLLTIAITQPMFDSPEPFDWYRPSMQFQVSPIVPKDRQIGLQQDGEHIHISGLREAQSEAVYIYNLICGNRATDEMEQTTPYSWQRAVSASVDPRQLEDARCSGRETRWVGLIAAPGYAMVSGNFHFPGKP